MSSSTRIAGRSPNSVRSSRSAARPAAASMITVIADANAQLYSATLDTTQTIA